MEEDLFATRPRLQALQDASDWLIENNTEDRVTANNINNQMSAIVNHFQDLADKLNEKQNILQRALLQVCEFSDTYNGCLDQLAELEVRLNRYTPLSVKYEMLWKQDEEFSAYETDVLQVKLIFEQLVKLAKKVKDSESEEESKDKESKIKELSIRIDNLEKKVKKRCNDTQKLLTPAKAHQSIKVFFKSSLKHCEDDYSKIKYVPKSLLGCEKQLMDIEEIILCIESSEVKHKEMNLTLEKVEEVVKTIEIVTDESSLKEEVRDLNQKWDLLQTNIKYKQEQVPKLKSCMSEFDVSFSSLQDDLNRFNYHLDDELAFGLDSTAGREKLEEVSGILLEVKECNAKLEVVNESGKNLSNLLEEYNADSHTIHNQLFDVNKDFQHATKQLTTMECNIKNQVKIVDKFFDHVKDAEDEVKKITQLKDNLTPLSAEPNVIKEQLSEVESILNELYTFEPKNKELEDLCTEICDNDHDFSVKSECKHNVQKIMDPICRLTMKLVERKNKLQNLLVGSQDLQDSLDDFSDKLTKIEKVFEKIKPVSAVYTIVKKQESSTQKLLEETVSLRGSLDLLERTADKLTHHTEGKEEEQINKAKEKLKSRWEVLHVNLIKRNDKTESVVPVAQDYDERQRVILEWLMETEIKLAADNVLTVNDQNLAKELEQIKVCYIIYMYLFLSILIYRYLFMDTYL